MAEKLALRERPDMAHAPPMSRLARVLVASLLVATTLPIAVAGAAGPSARIRVDQVGYTPEQPKIAWLLTPRSRHAQPFRVESRDGTVVFSTGRTR